MKKIIVLRHSFAIERKSDTSTKRATSSTVYYMRRQQRHLWGASGYSYMLLHGYYFTKQLSNQSKRADEERTERATDGLDETGWQQTTRYPKGMTLGDILDLANMV